MLKNLKKLENYEIWKIDMPSSIESWTEYFIVKDKKEAELALQLIGKEDKKLEYVSGNDNIYMFKDEK